MSSCCSSKPDPEKDHKPDAKPTPKFDLHTGLTTPQKKAPCCSMSEPGPSIEKPSPSSQASDCCGGNSKKSFDWLLWGSLIAVALGYTAHLFFAEQLPHQVAHFSMGGVRVDE